MTSTTLVAEDPQYAERVPDAAVAPWIRSCWIQSAGTSPYLQRHLPTGGVEVRCTLGGQLTLVGPSTSVTEELLPAGAVVLGIRFWPGAPVTGGIPAHHLTDVRLPASEVWGLGRDRWDDPIVAESDPDIALGRLIDRVGHMLVRAERDALVADAVRGLMPWRPIEISALARDHSLSGSQLRRRFLDAVGLSPKVLQRTLRFQGYLALAQAASASGRRSTIAEVGAIAGYADQPHLTRECLRLTGRTPAALFGSGREGCGCGHDHSGSYLPFLRGRAFRSIVQEQGLLASIA